VVAANNNCIPAHTGGTGSLIILHGGGRSPKQDSRLTDAMVGRSHDLRQPGEPAASAGDVLSTLTELKPVQTYGQQSEYLSPYAAPYDGTFASLWTQYRAVFKGEGLRVQPLHRNSGGSTEHGPWHTEGRAQGW